ncbi:PorV/PorQ family protein [candidate division KSB1 bacterium]|nr:PorV/PorQ family protein [candidate division KSB1 bacterium]
MKIIIKYITVFFVCVSLLLAAAVSVKGQNSFSNTGATFLQVNSGARQVAMAEAFTALAHDDINLMRYNIGGLGSIRHFMLSVNYHQWLEDTEQGAIGLSLPTRFGVIGFDFNYFNEGNVTELDANFIPTGGQLGSNDIALTLGYGSQIKLGERTLYFGGGLKFIRQTLASESANAFGLDVGTLLWLKYISLGLSIQNFGLSNLKFVAQEEPLPEMYRAGIGTHIPLGEYILWNTDFDLGYMPDQNLRYYCGTEFIINELFMIRGGYKIHDAEANRWAVGLGLMIPMSWLAASETRFDYSYSPVSAFDQDVHRFSLLFRFGSRFPLPRTNIPGEQALNELNMRLQQEIAAAEKARIAAEESELRTRALEDTLRARLERIKRIASESGGKIVVEEAGDIPPGEISDKILVTMRINFDFDKANIRPPEFETMRRVGDILNTYPESQVFISGHTDAIGTDEYNIRLSKTRVDSVMRYLTQKEQVLLDRFFNPIGYGELKPVADNDTPEGRFLNRRVDFLIYTMDQKPDIPEGSAITHVENINDSTIHIVGNGVLNFNHRLMDDPYRLVIDLPKTFLLTPQRNFDLFNPPFIRARLGYHPDNLFSRVVFDLYGPVEYDIYCEGKKIVITVKK